MNKLIPVHKPCSTESNNPDGKPFRDKDCAINQKILDQQRTETLLLKEKKKENNSDI